jgi:hypothetical protein
VQRGSPDFYLGSTEHCGDWARARACWLERRFEWKPSWLERFTRRKRGREYILITVDPPVIGQPYGMGDKDIVALVLAPRYASVPFPESINRRTDVLVYRILNASVLTQQIARASDLVLEAWGEVYPTLRAAEEAASVSEIP